MSDSLLIVQINAFYHIDFLLNPPDENSMVLPRLATILTRLRTLEHQKMVDSVVVCLPGDFLNPSCLSRHYHSRQIVDLMNAIGLNCVTFGNHEFDFDQRFTPETLLQRIRQSDFKWIGSNFEFFGEKSARQFLRHPKLVDSVSIDFPSESKPSLAGCSPFQQLGGRFVR